MQVGRPSAGIADLHGHVDRVEHVLSAKLQVGTTCKQQLQRCNHLQVAAATLHHTDRPRL